MNPPKPPPQTLRPDDERKIQIFLERASSIVLERPVLDLVHWRRLVSLAEELGLSEAELRSTVNDLRHRGIISEIDLSPPKPPPLPSHQGQPVLPVDLQPGPEQDFSLTPPLPPPPSPVQHDSPVGAKTGSSNGTPAPPPVPTRPGSVELSHEDRVRRYLERAQAIIAEQRGFGGRTQALLAAVAGELSLSDEEATNALQSLGREPDRSPPPPAVSRANETRAKSIVEGDGRLRDSRRWRVEGAPPPEPPPPSRKPEAIFRDYLSASLAQITDGVLPVVLENKFIKHGTSVLGLARTFAQHLVCEEAAEKGLRFESQQAGVDSNLATTAEGSEEDALCDANVKRFLERSVPILARHRGINAKSRVLLNAIAQELGLSEEQVERAIAVTQFRATTTREDADAIQQERLVGFRALVQGALISLPRKLLTPDIRENLCRHGEERHGIKADLVASVVREVCVALGIRQISEQQAREHVERLVAAKLAEHPRLQQDVRTRIESEGQQWGLNADLVASIIKEQTRLRDKRHRSERNFTHGALLAASIAALMVAGFFGWVAFEGDAPELPLAAEIGGQPKLPAPLVVDESQVDTAWWGEELEFAIGTARRDLRSQRPLFIQIESQDPATRRAAYSKLLNVLFTSEHDAEQLDLLMRVISFCYARDPDPPTARQLLDEVITRIPRSEHDLQADATIYRHAFLAAQTALGLIAQAADERESDASTELGRAIGRTMDAGLEPPTLQQHAYEGVADRLYRLLVALAKSEPARAASAHALIQQQTAKYVDAPKLEKLDTDFLVVVLTGADPAWREYEPLIRVAVASKNPLNTIRMLEVYEKATDLELQALLTEALIERLGKAPESREVAVIANEVRKSLGVAAEDVDNKRLARFLVGATSLLEEPSVASSEPDAMLVEIVSLAYHSTLGCAVAQGNAGDAAFDAIAAQDPAALLASGEPTVSAGDDKPRFIEPTTLRILNERLSMLLNSRNGPVARLGFISTIAGLTDRVNDLAPDQAAALATYLLGKKRVEEHRAILPHVADLRKWKQVRLAVADQLEKEHAHPDQLQDIVSKLLGRDYEIGPGEAGLEALRVELLRDVLVDAKKEDIGDQNKFQVYNRAAKVLYDFYTTQASLLRVAEWPGTPVTPTVVSQAMLESRVKQLLESKLAPDTKQQVEQIDIDSRSIDYLAQNDLQKLALLDRAWLRLLAVEFARKHAARKAEADAIVEQLATRDRQANHVLTQLRDGQASILRLWLLLNDAN